VLLVGLALYWASLEAAAHFGFSRVSRIQRRVSEDLAAARSLRPQAGGSPSVLVVGNSLLLKGIDRDSLREAMAPSYAASVLPIENTQVLDWIFGSRRLFAEGSRPSVVVAVLGTRHMMSRATCGEYFAHLLMPVGDLFEVKREAQLSNTVTSDYFFAYYSEWLGSRSQIKNWLLNTVMPGLDRLVGYFTAPRPPFPPAKEVVAESLPHLIALDRACRDHGARLIVVVPPPNHNDDGSAEVQAAAARAGVTVLIPMRPDEVPPDEFEDGYHLNKKGAARFTSRLAAALAQTLSHP